jgi:peptidase E
VSGPARGSRRRAGGGDGENRGQRTGRDLGTNHDGGASHDAAVVTQRAIVLLGPQRLTPTLIQAVDALGVDGPIATITAGWQDREAEDQELHEHLGGRGINLRLYERAERIFARDRELATAHRERQQRLRELRELYNVRLAHAMDAVMDLLRHKGDPVLLEPERDASLDALHALDDSYLQRVVAVQAEFDARLRPRERNAVASERTEIARQLDGCAALAIAGGHIALLLNRLRLLGVAELLDEQDQGHARSGGQARPVFAWSAGAMAISERIVLFHDNPPQGPGNAEVFDFGLALCRGVVPLPHARRRLRLDDPARVARFARRFAPLCCVAMEDGARLTWRAGEWTGGPGIQRLTPQGALAQMEAACAG